MPNKHTTNDTIKNNTTKADGNGQRNGLTNARNKYKTNLIVHVNRNSSLLEPAVLINFNAVRKWRATAGLEMLNTTVKCDETEGGFIEGVSCGKIG